jgi:type VI secretion system secreted protein VgrG
MSPFTFARSFRRSAPTLGFLALGLLFAPATRGQTILGSTGSYGVMAGSTVTINGGSTVITGALGQIGSAGTGTFTATGGAVTTSALNQTDFTRAYNGLDAMTTTSDRSGVNLGGLTLTPGVYNFSATAELDGILTLNAENKANAVWVFKIGTTLNTTAGSSVVFQNLAANSATNNGLFWRVGSTTVIGANSALAGNFLTGTTFTIGSGATITNGRALTGTGAITLDTNTINFGGANSGYSGGLAFDGAGISISAVPEPSAYALMAGLAMLGVVMSRRRRHG